MAAGIFLDYPQARPNDSSAIVYPFITMFSVYYISFLAFVFYRASKVVYNLYFHPLAKFPGPKLAAASHLYEFYWSIVRDGEFIWALERMHKKYGECVRQNIAALYGDLTDCRPYCAHYSSRAPYQ